MNRARLYRGTRRNLEVLANRLKAGELVAVPTETVYGLAADAFSAAACRKIFAAKGRPANDPLIVHIHSLAQLETIAHSNEAAKKLARAFWPGPLTLVLPKKEPVPLVVTSGRETVAVRMPAHALFRRLLRATGRPLAAPSANPFGYISPTTAEHVRISLGEKIRHILDGGPAEVGIESTIVDLTHPRRPRLLRPGAVTARQIEKVLGTHVTKSRKVALDLRARGIGIAGRTSLARRSRATLATAFPGQFLRHYSPRTLLRLHRRLDPAAARRSATDEAWIFYRRPAGLARGRNIFWLDEGGSPEAAARNLFAVLRQADKMGVSIIHAEMAPGSGLADAINDRLRRAAGRDGSPSRP